MPKPENWNEGLPEKVEEIRALVAEVNAIVLGQRKILEALTRIADELQKNREQAAPGSELAALSLSLTKQQMAAQGILLPGKLGNG